ncbi:MAG: pyridoxal-phosphate dependent enzyme [candidate division Zixibacteria bacterium]|nr:pyridoxal-phosphate dependent enzyme [candidate division Zixibacteria bacterium]
MTDLTERRIDLIDDAEGKIFEFAKGVEEQRKIAADTDYPMAERLEAYEDIIDSEVGDTSLWRARNIEREVGLRQIYFKFEGSNPTGSHKDRIAFAQVLDAMRRGYDTVSIATCGNYGVAMALATSLAGLKCLIHIPQSYHSNRIREMEELGARIEKVPGDYESAVVYSQKKASQNEFYDANPGGQNVLPQMKAYGEIAYEIYDELRDAPPVVAVPVSNGTTLAGIYKGFLSLYRRGKTSKIPRMVAGSSFKKNPIIQAWLSNLESCEDLPPDKIKETRINEPLINWHSIDGDLALTAIRHSNGWASNISDKNMMTSSRLIREKEGLHVLPASTTGLVALIEKHKKESLPNDRYVIVLTGKKT